MNTPPSPLVVLFQSTRPRGARRALVPAAVRLLDVSIHAPARGATGCPCWSTPARRSFNPRARAGRDGRGHRAAVGQHRFNPRARAGRDRGTPGCQGSSSRFNPRARAGRDVVVDYPAKRITVFQSTRPRGARLQAAADKVAKLAFQSTRPRGARPGTAKRRPLGRCFNPRARAGRDDPGRHRARDPASVSIHAPARGATPGLYLRVVQAEKCPSPRTAKRRAAP